MQAIRGATDVREDTRQALVEAVGHLCREICARNHLDPSAIVSAIFTLTPDLTAEFPASIARELGWAQVPMLCAQEIPVPNAMARICRVLVYAELGQRPQHVYLGRAASLRLDWPQTPAGAQPEENKR